jgi:hypothetical protein
MRAPGKTADFPFVPFVKTSPLIDPSAGDPSWAKQGLRRSMAASAISINIRTAAPPVIESAIRCPNQGHVARFVSNH